jgi:hypothetical protein
MKQGAYSLKPGMAGADPNAVGPYSVIPDDPQNDAWYKNPEVQKALLEAGVATGKSLLSHLQQRKANTIQAFNSINPLANMQVLNSSFTIPGMQSVNSLLQR